MQNMEGKTALGLDTGIGVLICYFGNLACGLPLGLIYSILVIVQDKTNKVARFHAFQSLFLMIAGAVIIGPLIFIVMFAGVLIDSMIGLPIVSILGGLLLAVLGIGMAIFVILAAIKGFGGEIYKVPVIGNFAEKYANG